MVLPFPAGKRSSSQAHPHGAVLCEPNAILEGVQHGPGQGTDLCNKGVVCAIPRTLIDGLPLPQGAQDPLLFL